MSTVPILYSFRRCPYAIRARLAIKVSKIQVEIREVVLADKPKELLICSAKATVPVLQLIDGTIIDESRDIMEWALNQHDPDNWLNNSGVDTEDSNRLITINDHEFKQHLDHYKYADRFPEQSMSLYRKQGEVFLQQLEKLLNKHKYLQADNISMSDMAIFPFIRQFACVDKAWFDQSPYTKLQVWLEEFITCPLFHSAMMKYPTWQHANEAQYL